MSHTEKLDALRVEIKKEITEFLNKQENQSYELFNLNSDWRDDEEKFDDFYCLPQEFVFKKYYAIQYYIYKLYLKEGKIYFVGHQDEDGDDETLEFDWLFTDTLCQIVEQI